MPKKKERKKKMTLRLSNGSVIEFGPVRKKDMLRGHTTKHFRYF